MTPARLTYGSVCSGIEAASVAWHPLGWRASFFSEIDPFPRAVLAHRFPEVPCHGDFTTIRAGEYDPIQLLVGGTPCQSFSVAGLRGGLGDDRGNLALEYLRLADRLRPRWLVWENVPGVLSSGGGRDFGSILGGLVELGYGFAYRVLDAQYVRVDGLERAVPQRRRRVFVVGYSGDWRPAAAVLFERQSLSGHPAPRRKAGQGVAPTIAARTRGGGGLGTDFDCDGGLICANSGDVGYCLTASAQQSLDAETEALVAQAYAIQERAVSENPNAGPQGAGWQPSISYTLEARHHVQAVAFDLNQITSKTNRSAPDPAVHHTLPAASCPQAQAVAFQERGRGDAGRSLEWQADVSYALTAPSGGGRAQERNIATPYAVRRLTPRECERLQGFPDDWTDVPYRGKPASDGPRYKALGNSFAVNVVRWLGQRIQMVESIING